MDGKNPSSDSESEYYNTYTEENSNPLESDFDEDNEAFEQALQEKLRILGKETLRGKNASDGDFEVNFNLTTDRFMEDKNKEQLLKVEESSFELENLNEEMIKFVIENIADKYQINGEINIQALTHALSSKYGFKDQETKSLKRYISSIKDLEESITLDKLSTIVEGNVGIHFLRQSWSTINSTSKKTAQMKMGMAEEIMKEAEKLIKGVQRKQKRLKSLENSLNSTLKKQKSLLKKDLNKQIELIEYKVGKRIKEIEEKNKHSNLKMKEVISTLNREFKSVRERNLELTKQLKLLESQKIIMQEKIKTKKLGRSKLLKDCKKTNFQNEKLRRELEVFKSEEKLSSLIGEYKDSWSQTQGEKQASKSQIIQQNFQEKSTKVKHYITKRQFKAAVLLLEYELEVGKEQLETRVFIDKILRTCTKDMMKALLDSDLLSSFSRVKQLSIKTISQLISALLELLFDPLSTVRCLNNLATNTFLVELVIDSSKNSLKWEVGSILEESLIIMERITKESAFFMLYFPNITDSVLKIESFIQESGPSKWLPDPQFILDNCKVIKLNIQK